MEQTNEVVEYDWDQFWDFASKSMLFLRFLYFVHFKQYRKLLKGIPLSAPRLLELGAGTGVIPQKLLRVFGGAAVLVDSNPKAFRLFQRFKVEGLKVEYRLDDMFSLDYCEAFDIVSSDGLLEHFRDKARILELHKRATKPEGYIILFIPNSTSVMRFLERRKPEFGREELLTLPQLVTLCDESGLSVIRQISYFFEIGVLCRKVQS